MPTEDPKRALSAMGGLVLELFARQIAILGLLRTKVPIDEMTIRKAISDAHEQLARIPGVATLRSQADAQQLEGIEKAFRAMVFPQQK